MLKFLRWLDDNLVAVLAGFLLVFIPLYPKWPLFEAIPGYLVRVRLEDILVAATLVVYCTQLLRKKVVFAWNPAVTGLFIYILVGFLSVISSIYIIQTVPAEPIHAGKTFLHFLRRIEYFSLFFILFGAIKSQKFYKTLLVLFFITLVLVTLYGFGQKYLYWPAFSTMNREFAKGWWLYLTEHARVLSTFGGHYDLAGYLVIALSLCWSFFFGLENKIGKALIGLILAGGFWLLILTASRISFISYLLGLSVVVFLWTFKKGLTWGLSRWLVACFLSIILMLSFGDLSERFLKLLKLSDRFQAVRQLVLAPAARPPTDKALFLENNLAAVTSRSDQPPTPGVPYGVTGREPELLTATISATGERILVPRTRTYSPNAFLFDLSTAIRLDATWPRAIEGFKVNPLLGSGYATLTKTAREQFTEAESTDNDYLRALGETGLLGFISFFGTVIIMVWLVWRSLGGIKDTFLYSLAAGFIGVVGGLLVNAVYIDIFEASKVAYVFWAVSGITLGSIYLNRERINEDREPLKIEFSTVRFLGRLKNFFYSDKFWLLILATLAFILRMYKYDAPLADWHSWRQADTSAVTRNYLRYHHIDWLYPVYDDLSSVASGRPNLKGLRLVEFPIYNAASFAVQKLTLLSVEAAGRVTTALASVTSLVFLFLLARQLASVRVAYLSALCFALLPFNIFYGRVILPEPTMVAFCLGALWFTLSYFEAKKVVFILLSLVFSALALLVKPFAIFLLLPLIYLWLVQTGLKPRTLTLLALFFLLAFLPLLLWRLWISQFPEGIPASGWLLNGDGIRFKGAFWYWLFAERVGKLILGYWGLVLLGFGLAVKSEGRHRFFPHVLLGSSLLFLFVFATGNVRHDYYQILLLPSLSILVGMGLDSLLSINPVSKILALVSFLFMLTFSWYFVRDYYNINHPEIVEAGSKVREISNWRSLVIAPYDADTAFLYQTDRSGWPIVEQSVDHLIASGADYYVSVRLDDLTNKLLADSWPIWVPKPEKVVRKYKLLARTDRYVIIQLVPDSELPKGS